MSIAVGQQLSMTPGVTSAGAVSFSVAPALPSGLSIDPATGRVAGVAQAIAPKRAYVITSVDAADGTSATTAVTLEVTAAPSDLGYVTPLSARVGSPIAITPGVASSGPATFTVAPSLPSGLRMDPTTGRISGTPTETSPTTAYTVTLRDGNGARDTVLAIQVLPRSPSISTGAQEVIIPVQIQSRPQPTVPRLPTFPSATSGQGLVGVVVRPTVARRTFSSTSARVARLRPGGPVERVLVIGAQRTGFTMRLRVILPRRPQTTAWIDYRALRLVRAPITEWRRFLAASEG